MPSTVPVCAEGAFCPSNPVDQAATSRGKENVIPEIRKAVTWVTCVKAATRLFQDASVQPVAVARDPQGQNPPIGERSDSLPPSVAAGRGEFACSLLLSVMLGWSPGPHTLAPAKPQL